MSLMTTFLLSSVHVAICWEHAVYLDSADVHLNPTKAPVPETTHWPTGPKRYFRNKDGAFLTNMTGKTRTKASSTPTHAQERPTKNKMTKHVASSGAHLYASK